MCTPDENSQLELEVFPNILDKERRNILRFMTHDNEQLAVVVLRQERLAEKVGTRKSNISRLESGRYNPSLDFLEKVAGGLGREIEVKVT
jgi:DNA-binding XRE family transcriptional regulator